MKNIFSLFFLLITCCAFADNYPRNNAIDIKQYIFQLELNDTTDIVAGEAVVQLLIKSPIKEFELDLINQNAEKKGMLVSGVSLNGVSLKYTHEHNRLKIFLPTASNVNDLVSISIQYQGIPLDGLIISKNRYGDRTFFGDNWPDRARNWLPSVDHPSEKASVDFIVIAPVQYSVIGNGMRLEESYLNKKQKRTHWHEAADISTKVMVIGVAKFAIQRAATIDNIPVESWVYPQNRVEGFSDYSYAATVMKFFIQHIGPYPYEKLANVQSSTIMGGMENASNIFYPENMITGKGDSKNTIVHEVAHQWFGNSATESDWSHLWLSEGFATYCTHLFNEATYGKDHMKNDLLEDRKTAIAHCKSKPAMIVNTTVTEYMQLLTPDVYPRASWVLHMLRNEVGDENFWKGVREYYKTYQNKTAQTSDLQTIMEKASGKKLAGFFQQWLYRPEIPKIKASWAMDKKGNSVGITVEQVQTGLPFDFPIEIGLVNDKGAVTIEKARINQKTQKLTFSVAGNVQKIILDPQINLLFEEIVKN